MAAKMAYDVMASFTCPRTITFQDYRLGFTHKAIVWVESNAGVALCRRVSGRREGRPRGRECRDVRVRNAGRARTEAPSKIGSGAFLLQPDKLFAVDLDRTTVCDSKEKAPERYMSH